MVKPLLSSTATNHMPRPLTPILKLAALALLLVGCGRSSGKIVDTSSVRIEFRRDACFGACPVYRLTVTGDRRVTFKGESNVAIADTVHDTLSVAQFGALLHAVEVSGILTHASYDKPGCEDVTDMPSARIDVQGDGKTRYASHYFGCKSAPKSLAPLEAAIDSIVGVERWVGPDSLRSAILDARRRR